MSCVSIAAASGTAQPNVCTDPVCDQSARLTDPGGDNPFDPQVHRLIDLHEIAMGKWSPVDPATDLFNGSFTGVGQFVRIDVVLGGLVNPPGDTDPLSFDPFAYGDHPAYGFVEIDMDSDPGTGGEMTAPEYRYLGNVARFGGIPEDESFHDRVAEDESAFDQDFASNPWVERHGEEFHLALLGGGFGLMDIEEVAGDGDQTFDAGETWDVWGSWFHRAHGFEPFSVASGGAYPGEYAPATELRFEHDLATDRTTLSLVYPLDAAAAGAMNGEPPQQYNNDPSDHYSLTEAFDDLQVSATIVYLFGSGAPEEQIIVDWMDKSPADHIDPAGWRLTALVGTSYTVPEATGQYFVWTDVYPNPIRGDVNGENGSDQDDRALMTVYIADEDASDGQVDGVVTLLDFATAFTVFDVNHDGQVDATDLILVADEGDCDDDEDVDLADFAAVQTCFSGAGGGVASGCVTSDLDFDGDVDLKDVGRFEDFLTGPGGGS